MAKVCRCCKQELDESAFGVSRALKDGLTIYCRPCIAIKAKESRQRVKQRWDACQDEQIEDWVHALDLGPPIPRASLIRLRDYINVLIETSRSGIPDRD